MASEEKPLLEVLLTCPVCQDIFKEPRLLPCGHSMCMGCLEGMIDHSDYPFRCPDCRAYFGPVIGVQKSFSLSNIAEDYRDNWKDKDKKKTEKVYCDCCPERRELANKTCLQCEVSLCKEHIRDHLERPAFTGHPLVSPLGDLGRRKCPLHDDEVLRYYCKTSRRYVCNICALETKERKQADEANAVLYRKITEYMDQRFNSLEGTIAGCKDSIRKLQDNVENEKQNVKPNESPLNSVTVVLLCLWFIVLYYAYTFAVESQTLRMNQDVMQTRLHNIHSIVAEFLAGHTEEETIDLGTLTLDLNTASAYLKVSPDLHSVERVKAKLTYPGEPRRFDEAPQVLSAQCFTSGAHSWEVEAEGFWDIAVSYRSIDRKSKDISIFGKNTQSWSLTCNDIGELSTYHNKKKKVLPAALKHKRRIAVTVDFEEGVITFSEVESKLIQQLYEYQTKLSQPVCLGVGLYRVDPPSRASIVKVLNAGRHRPGLP